MRRRVGKIIKRSLSTDAGLTAKFPRRCTNYLNSHQDRARTANGSGSSYEFCCVSPPERSKRSCVSVPIKRDRKSVAKRSRVFVPCVSNVRVYLQIGHARIYIRGHMQTEYTINFLRENYLDTFEHRIICTRRSFFPLIRMYSPGPGVHTCLRTFPSFYVLGIEMQRNVHRFRCPV